MSKEKTELRNEAMTKIIKLQSIKENENTRDDIKRDDFIKNHFVFCTIK